MKDRPFATVVQRSNRCSPVSDVEIPRRQKRGRAAIGMAATDAGVER